MTGSAGGLRSHSSREAAVELQSSMPWIGFPVGYVVSGTLLTVFGYFVVLPAQ
jgi:putative transport protein